MRRATVRRLEARSIWMPVPPSSESHLDYRRQELLDRPCPRMPYPDPPGSDRSTAPRSCIGQDVTTQPCRLPGVSVNAFLSEIRLTGHGLVLREWTEQDLATMVELFDDPDVAYRTPIVSPFDLAAARDVLQKARRARAEEQRIHLAITTDGRRAKG